MGGAAPSPEAVLEFVARVARAESVEELQKRYLDGVRHLIGGFAAGIYLLDPFRSPTDSFAASSFAAHGVSDFFLSRYEEVGRGCDPVLKRAIAEHAAVDNRMLMAAERWRSLPVYEEVFHLHAMTGLLEVPLTAGGEVLGTLNFGRHDGDGPFTVGERALADTLAQLISGALRALRERDRLACERDGVLAALELCHEAIVVTDLGRASRRLNAAARELLDRVTDCQHPLDALMAAPARAAGAGVTVRELPVRAEGRWPALLRARSTTAAHDPQIVVSFLALICETDRPALPASLRDSLTAREREVVELAVTGLRDAEIAERLHISPYTVKQYLRAAYGKCGVRSRVELAHEALTARGS